MPFETIAIPLLMLVNNLPWIGPEGVTIGWLNSYHVQIVPWIADGLTIFLFVQYFKDLPRELIEAARLDGATWFDVYRRVIVPISAPVFTLLRMIAGLEDITAGELKIGDRVCNDLQPRDRGVAMVFQSYALYPHMTVYDNMGFGLLLSKAPKQVRDEKVRAAARILQMEHLLDRKPAQLSGGQRLRVAIGRAIVRQPEVFLFDEPLSILDAALRMDMRMELAKLHADLVSTMIYVTHDQVEAMTLADKIVVLNAGVVQQVGSPLELYHRPPIFSSRDLSVRQG